LLGPLCPPLCALRSFPQGRDLTRYWSSVARVVAPVVVCVVGERHTLRRFGHVMRHPNANEAVIAGLSSQMMTLRHPDSGAAGDAPTGGKLIIRQPGTVACVVGPVVAHVITRHAPGRSATDVRRVGASLAMTCVKGSVF
jgi:hypothetical protein